MSDRLYRSTDDRMLAGVAGGLAELWDADPSLIRIIWALLIFFTGGIFLVVYVVMALVVPEDDELDRDWPPPATATAESTTAPASAPASSPGPASSPAPAPAPGALWAPSPTDARRQARREARAARRAAGGSERRPSGTLIAGGLLVLLGGFFLVREFLPAIDFDLIWPLALVGVGLVLLVYALRPGRDGGAPP